MSDLPGGVTARQKGLRPRLESLLSFCDDAKLRRLTTTQLDKEIEQGDRVNYRVIVAASATATVGFLVLTGAGCGSSPVHRGNRAPAVGDKPAPGAQLKRLTPATVETQIRDLQQRVGISVKSVHCPRHVEIMNGHTFRCVTTLRKGAAITTMVTPTNVALGLARFQFPLPPGLP